MIAELHALELETMLNQPAVVNYLVQARARAALAALLEGRIRDARVLLVGIDSLCSGDSEPNPVDVQTMQETPAMIRFAVEIARQAGRKDRAEYLLSALNEANT